MRKLFFLGFIIVLGSCETIFLENISSEKVVLVAPADSTTIKSGALNFFWNPVEDADSYHIQISTPNFEKPTRIVLDSIVTKTVLDKTITAGMYQWRVKAMNSAYETNYTTNNFTIN